MNLISKCNEGNSQSLVWWMTKNLCGLSLIVAMIVAVISNPAPILSIPVLLSQALVITGGATSLFHYALFKRENPRVQEPRQLVSKGGLLKWVRHPMYLGDSVMFFGLWTFFPAMLTLPILLLAYVAIYQQAKHEDRFLSAQFGAVFQHWYATSGLLIPRLFGRGA